MKLFHKHTSVPTIVTHRSIQIGRFESTILRLALPHEYHKYLRYKLLMLGMLTCCYFLAMTLVACRYVILVSKPSNVSASNGFTTH